jgi:hypothetical protein
MSFDEFVEELYHAGWTAPNDALTLLASRVKTGRVWRQSGLMVIKKALLITGPEEGRVTYLSTF